MFYYASQQQIQRALKRLEEAGAIRVGNFNSNPYDHTKWYTDETSNRTIRVIKSDQSTNSTYKNTNTVEQKDNLFELFWKNYPRKTNKGFARKVFSKLKVDQELLNKMLKALAVQVPQWKDPQYIPHPSTWLNGERWLDEPQFKTVYSNHGEI